MGTLTTFDPEAARSQFEVRIDSLDQDTRRCFLELEGGPGPAFFPPVLYAFSTVDYFSSYWAGWNDSKGDRSKKQTPRLVSFMTHYLGYKSRESKVAVGVWRHKLMHTAEPRILRARNGDRFVWETGADLVDHMILVPTETANELILRFDSFAVVRDLREGILGPRGYLFDLCRSQDLQQKFLACYNEMENYTVDA